MFTVEVTMESSTCFAFSEHNGIDSDNLIDKNNSTCEAISDEGEELTNVKKHVAVGVESSCDDKLNNDGVRTH